MEDNVGLQLRFALYVFVVPIVVVFGVVGNILSIIVLGRDRIQPSTAFTLRALAAADIAFLLFCLLFTTQPALVDQYIESFSLRSQTVHHLFILYTHPVYHATQMVSTWTLVLVTLERYILVCIPLHAVKYVTIRRMTAGVAVICIAAFVFQIPLFFQTGCRVQLNSTSASCSDFLSASHDPDVTGKVSMTFRISNPLYHLIYRTLGYFFLRFILPFAILIYLSARLAQEIQKSRNRHNAIYASVLSNSPRGNATQERQGKYTRIVVTIVTLFCICLLPQAIFLLLLTLRNYKVLVLPTAFTFSFDAIASLLLAVNSSSNFIIYCVMRENFRNLIKKMFRRRKDPLLQKNSS
ncbi:hypothetical protein CAPTEDRAFT_209346 [Capitella teleta]|uniref:G-protein coupled receptors family 1 profile domain-containing protein n=1 Tax=Capitella teleta TaxID=283909 RepID=R7TCZ1_CAPTE|nr:hypothetical protein CAPTEDRAFT_209346 [Capitella teleta]|eukprot:ELT88941.1 hypothetical protein CAPTEDRAFT_209346 [Capitella teleta]